MKSFVIKPNDAEQRIDKFLSKAVPGLPKALMYKYIRLKRIKVNGKRTAINVRLKSGDVVDLYINDEFFQFEAQRYEFLGASKKLSILYEDADILIADKSVGLLSHPDDREYTDTLITRIHRYLYEKGEYLPDDELSFTPALVNRIDRNTGGIVIAAKTATALRILNEKMKKREIHKYYLCVVHGELARKSGLLEGWLRKDEDANTVRVFNTEQPDAKPIATKYRVLDCKEGMSLLEIELLTGRTHQIRAHFAHIGHPLVGDGKYGRNKNQNALGYKKQFLYSYKLAFEFSSPAGNLEYLNGQGFEVPLVWFAVNFPDNILSEH